MKAGRRKNDDTPKWLSENEVNASKLTLFQYISGNITLAAFFIAYLKKTLTIHYSCIKEKPRAFPETIRCLPLIIGQWVKHAVKNFSRLAYFMESRL